MATMQALDLQPEISEGGGARRDSGSAWARAQGLRELAERLRMESSAAAANPGQSAPRAATTASTAATAGRAHGYPATNAADLVHNRPVAPDGRQRAAVARDGAGQPVAKGGFAQPARSPVVARTRPAAAKGAPAQTLRPSSGSGDAMAQRDGGDEKRGRSLTIPATRLTRAEVAEGVALAEWMDYRRPANRGECVDGPRPCPYVSCKHHLYLDVNPLTGSIKVNFPDLEVWEMEESCALDIAERGGQTLEEVGAIMNLTRERIRQVEVSGLERLQAEDFALDLEDAFTS